MKKGELVVVASSSAIGHWSLVIGHSRKRGITLIELLLSLAIIVAIAAMATPSVIRVWERYRVKLAGDQLRSAFTHAHVEAMRTGQIQVMRLELQGNKYYLQPWMAGDEAINVSADEALEQSRPQYRAQPVSERTLPEDVIFESSESKFDSRALEIEEEAAKQQTALAQWSQPILFYPDGTSSSAKVTLANERGEAVEVTLRKLTGLSAVSDMTTLEALQSQSIEEDL
jgi:prepilin-type N-terminal cleavage/methylation domain-containing protein